MEVPGSISGFLKMTLTQDLDRAGRGLADSRSGLCFALALWHRELHRGDRCPFLDFWFIIQLATRCRAHSVITLSALYRALRHKIPPQARDGFQSAAGLSEGEKSRLGGEIGA